MSALRRPIHSVLSDCLFARPMRRLDLGFGRSAIRWFNRDDHVTYENPDGHTFSLYLRGGTGTSRLGAETRQGWPGALCLMPHGQSSTWEITSPFEFVHLYLPDQEARRLFAEIFDRDARRMSLPEITFGDRPELAAPLRLLAQAAEGDDPLAGEEAMVEILRRTLAGSHAGGALKGGLAPHARKRVLEFIEAGLDANLRLRELAGIAGLSEYHFQRSFAASLGVSPSAWVAHRRIEQARALLRGAEAIAGIAAACGYSSQSHFTRSFRGATGRTPAAYRALVRSIPGRKALEDG